MFTLLFDTFVLQADGDGNFILIIWLCFKWLYMEIFFLQLYHQVYDERAKDACLQLVGIVTYYGKHYSTFFFHSKLRTWIYFDDARVKEVSNPFTSRSDIY